MSDDLETIRAARLQQLQQQQSSSSSSPGGGGGPANKEDEQKAHERSLILSQILEPAASDRLGRIRMVNAPRAEDVESRLIMLARSGQLRGRVTEEQLKGILSAVAEQQAGRGGGADGGEGGGVGGVRVQRRGGRWDEDDLDDLLGED